MQAPEISANQPRQIAEARFSVDMVETLLAYFDHYATDDVVTVEVTTAGLWLQSPFGGRQFLGATEKINLKPRL